jgi:anti-sigma B factor antagonist
MNIEQKRIGDVVVLTVNGDITMGNNATHVADAVRRELDLERTRLLLDLGRVRYVDSTGLGVLVEGFSAAKNRGGALKLLHVTSRINTLLVITRLLTVFECFDEEAEAVASFQQGATYAAKTNATYEQRANPAA